MATSRSLPRRIRRGRASPSGDLVMFEPTWPSGGTEPFTRTDPYATGMADHACIKVDQRLAGSQVGGGPCVAGRRLTAVVTATNACRSCTPTVLYLGEEAVIRQKTLSDQRTGSL
jgi:hypothetical protein